MKILLFKKNSPWGIIKHPLKGNIYKNVLNFPNDLRTQNYPVGKIKHNFINKYLMEEEKDWLIELEKKEEILETSKIFKNETTFLIEINTKKDYNNWTRFQLMNVDYCCFKIYNKFYFGTAIFKKYGKGNGIIMYEIEIDLFFNYELKFRNGSLNYLKKGHVDRFFLENNNLKIIKNNLLQNESAFEVFPTISFGEKVETFFPTTGNLNLDIRKWVDNVNNFSINEKRYLREIINELKFSIFYLSLSQSISDNIVDVDVASLSNDELINFDIKDNLTFRGDFIDEKGKIFKNTLGGHILTRNNNEQSNLPYIIAIVPYFKKAKIKTFFETINGLFEYDFNKVFSLYGKKGDLNGKPFAIQSVNFIPNIFSCYFKKLNNQLIFVIKSNEYANILISKNFKKIAFLKYNSINNNNFNILNWKSKQKINELINYNFNEITISKNNILKNINLEPKLRSSQFEKNILTEWTGQKIEYNFLNLFENNEKINASILFSPENYLAKFYINEKNNNLTFEKNRILQISGNRNLPITTSAFLKYLNDNLNKDRNNKYYADVNFGVNTAFGVLGTIGSIFGLGLASKAASATGQLGAGAGVLGSVKSLADSGIAYERQKNERIESAKDLMNSPLQTTPVGNIFLQENEGVNGLFWFKETLNEKDKKKVYDYLFKYGYEVNELVNLNEIINSRHLFNYVECDDVFNTLDLDFLVSTRIKQLINDAFKDGIHIFHIRNEDGSFNGVLNYNFENWEEKLLKDEDYIVNQKEVEEIEIFDFEKKENIFLPLYIKGNINEKGESEEIEIAETSDENENEIINSLTNGETFYNLEYQKADAYLIPYQQSNQGGSNWRYGIMKRYDFIRTNFENSDLSKTRNYKLENFETFIYEKRTVVFVSFSNYSNYNDLKNFKTTMRKSFRDRFGTIAGLFLNSSFYVNYLYWENDKTYKNGGYFYLNFI